LIIELAVGDIPCAASRSQADQEPGRIGECECLLPKRRK
jgi:hypothetical protein